MSLIQDEFDKQKSMLQNLRMLIEMKVSNMNFRIDVITVKAEIKAVTENKTRMLATMTRILRISVVMTREDS